jgi:hypothetical protein
MFQTLVPAIFAIQLRSLVLRDIHEYMLARIKLLINLVLVGVTCARMLSAAGERRKHRNQSAPRA